MVVLAVDYGDARTGLAVCDRGGLLASPAGMIAETYEPKVIAAVCEKAAVLHAEKIVVGLPRNMDGSCGERAEKCRSFAEALQQASGIPCELFDERLTTVAAHRALNEVNVRGKRRKQVVDTVAAVMILEDYLRANK